MIKKICLCGLLLLVSVIVPMGGQAQPEMMRSNTTEEVPRFSFDVANVAADSLDRSRLYISVKISNDELQFLKVEDHFEAEHDITLVILDQNGDQVEGKSYRRRSVVTTYEQTNSNNLMNHFVAQLDLPPGEYTVICELTDVDSKQTRRHKQEITLRDFSIPEMSISDILFVEDRNFELTNFDETTSLSAECYSETMKQLWAYFEIYNSCAIDTYRISYAIQNFRNKQVDKKKDFTIESNGFRTKVFLPISTEKLSVAQYRLLVTVSDGRQKEQISRVFQVRSLHVPISITDLDQAIDQLQYIADKKDIKRMRKASEVQKHVYFEEFWKHKDPTPRTPVNELMEEYYQRVEVANKRFSQFRDGWKTDRGMVYIIFGAPDDVERQPYNVSSDPFSNRQVYAYEIWHYHDLGRRFIFADYQGFGEYRLVDPSVIYQRY